MNVLANLIEEAVWPVDGSSGDYDPLLKMVGDSRFVLLGEATHGTHEFYRERANITKRLIEEKGFNAVAVEADCPDAYRVNRFVRSEGTDPDAKSALGGFKRFPQWMWRNADVVEFVTWLHEHNQRHHATRSAAGFYGLDLYSLHASIDAVLRYLEKRDPVLAREARLRYGRFGLYGDDSQAYGFATGVQKAPSCKEEVIGELVDLRRRETELLRQDGHSAPDEFFFATQNAFVVKNAERYYREMYRGGVSSWNLRDQHMMDTLVNLVAHLERNSPPVKIVVWAHNSHLGNAKHTQMGCRGELNLGQLVRARFGHQAVLIGFTTYDGTVTAASDWDEPAEQKNIRPALSESYEALFHDVVLPRFWLDFKRHPLVDKKLRGPRLERAIGVIYRPETERASHYFTAHLSDQFDGILHFDETSAVEPLERTPQWVAGEVAEAYPTGL